MLKREWGSDVSVLPVIWRSIIAKYSTVLKMRLKLQAESFQMSPSKCQVEEGRLRNTTVGNLKLPELNYQ